MPKWISKPYKSVSSDSQTKEKPKAYRRRYFTPITCRLLSQDRPASNHQHPPPSPNSHLYHREILLEESLANRDPVYNPSEALARDLEKWKKR